MLSRLERVRLAARDPAAAAERYAVLLAREPRERREAARGAASAALFRLGNVDLEIAPVRGAGGGAAAGPGPPEPAGEGPAEGLAGLVFAAAELDRFAEAARARGLGPRLEEGPEGVRSLSLALEATRGVPIRVEEGAPGAGSGPDPRRTEADPPAPDAVRGLDHVVLRTSDADAAARLYAEGLGLRLALDRSFPDWGVRLLFFRVGGLTVELAASLGEVDDAGGALAAGAPDRLWGLSWRVDDVAAARERLARAGLDVSAVRAGRKPGTRVATVRDGTCGVPTLLIGPEAA